MTRDPILIKAGRLLRRKKFGEVIHTLEPEVVRYHDSFKYYYILGSSCLRIGDYGGALTYFRRCRDLKVQDPAALLGMAALFLRRGETDRAIDLYLEVLDQYPRNRLAGKALRVIRKYGGVERIAEWIESGRLSQLFPPLPSIPKTWDQVFLPILGALVLLTLGAGFYLIRTERWRPLQAAGASRQGYAGTALEQEERDAPVETGGSYRYILTRNEVLSAYSEARSLFTGYRDEAAKVALNRIIESNASEAVKNKARLLMSYTEAPQWGELRDHFSYSEVIREAVLYRDCYVIWRGMATKLQALENTTSFDLLVGYDTRSSLDGVVPVSFDFAVPVNVERPLEVLGRVIPVITPAGIDIRLEGAAVHQSGLLEKTPAPQG